MSAEQPMTAYERAVPEVLDLLKYVTDKGISADEPTITPYLCAAQREPTDAGTLIYVNVEGHWYN